MTVAAALALTAALLHVFNHSLFKSLLFFGAGAVLTATGERDMEHLGGLIHRMPQTAFVFLVGCAAISALPPLNGFVSEWLTFQAILLSPQLPSWGLKLLVPAVGALLALSAALAAACFVKAYGITFLGRPRTRAAEARDGDRSLFARRDVLLRGAVPRSPASCRACSSMRWRRSARALVGAHMPAQTARNGSRSCRSRQSRSSYNGLLVFVFMRSRARSPHSRSIASPRTGCAARRPGIAAIPTRARRRNIPPMSFAQPIRRVFGTSCFAPASTSRCRRPATCGRRGSRSRCTISIWDTLYAPLAGGIGFAADRLNRLQFLTIRQYLSLVFCALVILLLVLAIWP